MTEVGSCRKPFAARSKLRRLARQFSQTKSWREATRAAAYADIYFLPRGALPEKGVSHRRALSLSLSFPFAPKSTSGLTLQHLLLPRCSGCHRSALFV